MSFVVIIAALFGLGLFSVGHMTTQGHWLLTARSNSLNPSSPLLGFLVKLAHESYPTEIAPPGLNQLSASTIQNVRFQ